MHSPLQVRYTIDGGKAYFDPRTRETTYRNEPPPEEYKPAEAPPLSSDELRGLSH